MNLLNKIRTARAINLLRKAGIDVFVEIRQVHPTGGRILVGRNLKRFDGIHAADKAFEEISVAPGYYNTLSVRAVMAKTDVWANKVTLGTQPEPPVIRSVGDGTEQEYGTVVEGRSTTDDIDIHPASYEPGRQAVAAQEHGECPAPSGNGHECDIQGPLKAGPDDQYHPSCSKCGEPVMPAQQESL